ncbi:6304_t:CDS:1, partial [Acaulospora colombiana]
MVGWYDDCEAMNEGDALGKKRRMGKLKKIVMTRCIGGKRHSLSIKKILEDLGRMKDHQRKKNDDGISKRFHELNSNARESCSANGANTISSILFATSSFSANVSNDSVDDDTNDGIFQFRPCTDPTCESCTLSCADCGIKYKYWDKFWIKCTWCKDRHFC